MLITATPLAALWFSKVQGLSLELASLAIIGMWIALPIPGLNVFQSWYQGAIVVSRKTRGITEAVALFLITTIVVLWAGAIWSKVIGLYIGLIAFSIAMIVQTLWLWYRGRPALRTTQERDLRQSQSIVTSATAD
jgi:hypothetical protein